MNAEKLIELYDRVADAPDAIPRLRRFVLDLAVRGKLVEQDASDESAEVLLRLMNAVPSSGSDFAIPMSWAWVDLPSVSTSRLGKMLDRAKNAGEPKPYLRNLNVRWFDFDLGDLLEMPFEKGEIAELRLEIGDVLICEGGEPGRAAVWDGRRRDIYFQKALHRVRFCSLVNPNYFVLALKSSADDGRLAASFTGTGIKHLTGKGLARYTFPLPPPAEQHRIVARVDELMALLDRLEAASGAREVTRDRFTTASLTRLTAPDTDTRATDTQSTLDALPALTARTDQIKQLRQTILNLAATGALADQRATDGSAIDLLKELAEGQIQGRTRKKGAVRDPSALSGPLPASWVKVALGEVCELVTSGSRGWAEHYSTSGPAFIRAQNIRFGRLRLEDLACVSPPASAEGTRTRVSPGDLLVVITGAGVTNPALLDIDLGEAYVSQHVGLMRPSDTRLSRWMLLCLMADTGGREELVARAYGAGKPGLNLENLRSLSIPLPPLAEQHRIVAKVDELMALCDRLEAALTTADTTRARLLEALLHEALSPGQMRAGA